MPAPPAGRRAGSPGRLGDDLQDVAGGVVDVQAAAVVGGDLARGAAVGVGPEGQPSLADAGVDGVEVLLAGQERVALPGEVGGRLGVVHGDPVAQPDRDEDPHGDRVVQAEQVGQETRRGPLVLGEDDDAAEVDRHGAPADRGVGRRAVSPWRGITIVLDTARVKRARGAPPPSRAADGRPGPCAGPSRGSFARGRGRPTRTGLREGAHTARAAAGQRCSMTITAMVPGASARKTCATSPG
ncbi:hypothetical protein EIO00_11885 [Thermomonospora catenispora]|nr:hypothetical protein EIO00_11885 [Thermomonospora catenispora]